MSKAAELTREELVEKLIVKLHAVEFEPGDAESQATLADPSLRAFRIEQVGAVLSELKAMGLVLVPVELDGKMREILSTSIKTEIWDEGGLADVWGSLLDASPFDTRPQTPSPFPTLPTEAER